MDIELTSYIDEKQNVWFWGKDIAKILSYSVTDKIKYQKRCMNIIMKGIRVGCKHCHKLFPTKETSSTHYSVIHSIILYYLPAYHRTLCFWLQITLYCLPWWCIHKLLHKAYCLIFVLLYLDLFFQVRIHTIYIYGRLYPSFIPTNNLFLEVLV